MFIFVFIWNHRILKLFSELRVIKDQIEGKKSEIQLHPWGWVTVRSLLHELLVKAIIKIDCS